MKTLKRETWSRKIDFLLACIGFSVGLGNVWRFPYLCYKNGGGAFLIPYFSCVLIGGIPLFFLEVAVGQFMAQGGVNAWTICPILQGIGWTTTSIVFFLDCYYNVILAWTFYYIFSSFTAKLPWDSCDNPWNSEQCFVFSKISHTNTSQDLAAGAAENISTAGVPVNSSSSSSSWAAGVHLSLANLTVTQNSTQPRLIDATTEFWENKVLAISSGIHEMGSIKWDIAGCLLLAWVLVYFCVWKGIKTSGKVMYFTATAPYLFMIALLIRMAFLPGAFDGIKYYMTPDFTRLADMQVWVDAGTQIFFSYSISVGALTALGSYNKWNHNSYRDCMVFSCINSGTSILAGFVIFEVLGFMAYQQSTSIDLVAESGPGLAFIAYPKAVAQMPFAPLWSVLFFVMIILLGLDSQFVQQEGLITACVDTFPALKKGHRKKIFIAIISMVQFLVGLTMVTNGGMYVFQLFDYYSGSRIILLVAFFMCVAVAWIYGVKRFYDNLEMMFGFKIGPYMKIGWLIMSPVFCIVLFILSAINYSELTYERPRGIYHYPKWAVVIGWTLASFSALFIPGMALYKTVDMVFIKGKSWRSLLQPQGLKEHQLRTQDKEQLEHLNLDNETLYK